MPEGDLLFSFFLIFSGAALLATLALFGRQPLIIGYIVLGALAGPFGFHLIEDVKLLEDIAEIGIIFLLFLLGLDMQPSNLFSTLKKATTVAILSCFTFALIGFTVALVFSFSLTEAIIIGLCMMFSSTIIGIKLLPTTVLHHKHTGELMVGLLLLQDIIAIVVLLGLGSMEDHNQHWIHYLLPIFALPMIIILAGLLVKFVILPLLAKFDRFQEYIFLMAIGWCLGMAELAKLMGLSYEIGAFIAGISIASSPISQYIAVSLKPLRDFFLVLFFFALGASLNLPLLPQVMLPALILAGLMLSLKPTTFRLLLHRQSETNKLAWDVGFRLGQISEFSLLIAYIAFSAQLLGEQAFALIQTTAIITFAVSSYIVVMYFPNPIAVKDELRRD